MKGRLEKARTWVTDWIRSAPGTYIYLFSLLVTSWSLRGANPRLAEALIRSQSTNLDNLTDHPVQVLVASAFWTPGPALPLLLLLQLTLILAPVERRLGTRRTFGIFIAGHVIATLLVAVGIDYGVRHGQLDLGLAHAADVGVSYGLFAVAGALTWLLVPRLLRPIWVLALLAAIAVDLFAGLTFTDVGHVLSLAIGLLTAPLIGRWQRHPAEHARLAGQPLVLPVDPIRRSLRRPTPGGDRSQR